MCIYIYVYTCIYTRIFSYACECMYVVCTCIRTYAKKMFSILMMALI